MTSFVTLGLLTTNLSDRTSLKRPTFVMIWFVKPYLSHCVPTLTLTLCECY